MSDDKYRSEFLLTALLFFLLGSVVGLVVDRWAEAERRAAEAESLAAVWERALSSEMQARMAADRWRKR